MAPCPGCGRSVIAVGGGLDLLDDRDREAADRFAIQYAALRRKEGWISADGREDPEGGDPRLWRARLESVSKAASAWSSQWRGARRPLVIDVGSGGGWAGRFFHDADVIAIDLLDAKTRPGVLNVRADMRRLPLRDAAVDVALYAASLHYASISESIGEAARVLRLGGLVVAVDSPVYRDRRGQERAEARSAAYYAQAGFPELAAHYHPIDVGALRTALGAGGFEVLRLESGRTAQRWWERFGRPPRSFLVARRSAV
ncbi:MAG TPA: methyltransferase domain-containing protein [Candidatus Dormibacteraeota bacterium]